jgi:EAL domain-containing protein (putative c-di-GMP-specific phosphodiesterase class I)
VLQEANYRAAAERTGTAKMLDRWRILHAIKKINDTSRSGRKVQFFLPLSVDSLRDPGLAVWVSENLAKSKVNGEQLVFMIDEAQAVNQLKAAKALTKALQQVHCQFAIDEFGTGINPFQLAKLIEADYVRINHVYMDNLAQNNENYARGDRRRGAQRVVDSERGFRAGRIPAGAAERIKLRLQLHVVPTP